MNDVNKKVLAEVNRKRKEAIRKAKAKVTCTLFN